MKRTMSDKAADNAPDTISLNLRAMPLDLVSRLKAAAALSNPPVTMRQYVIDLLQEHLATLERKGVLPKK